MTTIVFKKLDQDSLKKMVLEYHMTDLEISKKSGISVDAICKRRKVLGLCGGSSLGLMNKDIEVFIETKKPPRFDPKILPVSKLKEMYIVNQMTDSAIASMYSTKEYVISGLRKKYGIKTLTQMDVKRTQLLASGTKHFRDLTIEEMLQEVSNYKNYNSLGKFYCLSKTSIRNILKEKGLNPSELIIKNKLDHETKFSSVQKDILIGSILGDGGISKDDFHYYETHATSQESYLNWKMKCLGIPLDQKKYSVKKRSENSVLSDAYQVGFIIHRNSFLNILRSDFYSFNKEKKHITKTTPLKYAYGLSNLSLAIWIFDDGFLKNNFTTIFSGSSLDDINEFVSVLNDEKNLNIIIETKYKGNTKEIEGHFIIIRNSKNLWLLVGGYVSDLMIHKFPKDIRSLDRGGLLDVKKENMEDLEHNINNITPSLWRSLSTEEEKVKCIDDIAKYYDIVGFPYAKPPTGEGFVNLINKLTEIDTTRYLTGKRVLSNVSSLGTSIAYSYFPNIFAVETTSKDNAYNRYKDSEKFRKVIRWILENETEFNESILRNELRRFCSVTNFKPLVAKYLCDRYCPENGVVFDYSAGWSGRLIGCCASSKVLKYIGTDVSKQTFFGLRRVVRALESIPINKKLEIYNFPSEDSENYISLEKFDVCLSSPPYFDMEKYSNDPEQSYRRYPEYDLWKEKFLTGVVSNCYKKLNAGGFFIINVADIKGHKLVQDTYDICSRYFEYVETIVMRIPNVHELKKFEPIMVFKKSIEDFNNPCFDNVQKQFLEDFSKSVKEVPDKIESIMDIVGSTREIKYRNLGVYKQEAIERSKEFAISIYTISGGTLERSRYSKCRERSTLSLLATCQIEEVFGTWSSFLNVCGIPVLKKFGNTITILEDFLQACRNNGHFLTFYAYNQISNDTAALSKLKRLFNKNGLLSSFTERLSQVWSSEEESCSFIRTIDNFLAVKKATKHVSSDLSPNN